MQLRNKDEIKNEIDRNFKINCRNQIFGYVFKCCFCRSISSVKHYQSFNIFKCTAHKASVVLIKVQMNFNKAQMHLWFLLQGYMALLCCSCPMKE